MQVCVADRLQIPPNDHLDTVGSENAFANKGYVLKMSLSERLSFSRNNVFYCTSTSVIEIMLRMLWEGGWEWTTLT